MLTRILQIKCTIALAIILFIPLSARAYPNNEFYISQALDRYFVLPMDAKSTSMIGSSLLNCADSNCIFLNPAGLGSLKTKEVSLSFGSKEATGNEFIIDEKINKFESLGHGILALPFRSNASGSPSYGTLALAYSRYQGETDDSVNTTPDGHRRSLAYGVALNKQAALGYSFTFYDDQLRNDLADLHSHSRFLHVFGAQYNPTKYFQVGAVFKLGIGQSDTEDFLTESNGLSHLRHYSGLIGATKYWSPRASTSMSSDISSYRSNGNLEQSNSSVVIGSDEEGHTFNIRLGIEYQLLERFFIRGGARYETTEYEFKREDLRQLSGNVEGARLSFGLGYNLKFDSKYIPECRIDYGFEYLDSSYGDWSHVVTATVPFNFF